MTGERMECDNVSGVSRRTVIKRSVAGAAVVWAAPTVLSMASPAGAASGLPNNCPVGTCNPGNSGNCSGANLLCGAGCTTGAANGGVGCFGVSDTEGRCICAQGVHSCGDLPQACTASSQCGAGRHCIVQDCCGRGNCYDCCGVNCH